MATYDETIIKKIRSFGALQYLPERICLLIGLTGDSATVFLTDIMISGHPANLAYEQGKAYGEYNVDASLMKASETGDTLADITLRERQQRRKITNIKQELFGL